MPARSVAARAAASLRLRALDARDRLGGRTDERVPPRRLGGFVGAGDFVRTGDEFAALFRELGGLSAGSRVLDVGCGIGRMARPLADVLDPDRGGGYVGFDVNREALAWCRERYPAHFRFEHIDVENDMYNPDGALAPQDVRFPVDAGWATLAIATSLFTHIDRAATDHYLGECARALAPDGTLVATVFALDPASRAAAADGRTTPPFPAAGEDVALTDPDAPSAAVAHDRERLVATLAGLGRPDVTVLEGDWRGAPGRSYQDVLVARA